MDFKTADLCDQFENRLGESLFVAAPLFQSYGARPRFSGEVVTIKVFEDNSLVRTALSEKGQGKVLVIDGGGSLRCALVGDQIAILAAEKGWEGLVVYGCIRDAADIGSIHLGVRALNTHPQKSIKKNVGERNTPVTFAGVTFRPGQWIYVDEDGILLSQTKLV